MEKASILNILKKSPLFEDFNENDFMTIIEHIILQYFPGQYTIFSEGDEGENMYIIKSGKIKIFHPRPGDRVERLAELKENEFFGEMALFSNEKRNASAITLTECELFVLQKKDFYELLLKDENMANRVSKEFIRRVRENNRNM